MERGFSVNKEMEVDNRAGSTFAAKRMVCDHVHSVLTTSMLVTNNCCCTVQVLGTNTPAYLEDEKKHRSKVVAGEKRKAL